VQPHLAPARHGTGRLWAFIGGGVAALAAVLVAVLAVTGSFSSGPPQYTQAQAVSHVRATAQTTLVRTASDASLLQGMRSVCASLSTGRLRVADLFPSGGGVIRVRPPDLDTFVGTSIAADCPRYYLQFALHPPSS
jgi:hypothetical protein